MTDTVAPDSNAQAYSVSELAFALKRTLEDRYSFVRLRGELSKVTHHGNGHVYLTIKDDKSAIDGVVWKGSVRSLGVRPEQGLEVIVTGKITTYPAGSRYQIVIETMEAAGVGALLAQLERLKPRLTEEGLFDSARKRRPPFAPKVIGVIRSNWWGQAIITKIWWVKRSVKISGPIFIIGLDADHMRPLTSGESSDHYLIGNHVEFTISRGVVERLHEHDRGERARQVDG